MFGNQGSELRGKLQKGKVIEDWVVIKCLMEERIVRGDFAY